MADLRLQSGRVQAQGISSLPQPNMNFGQQRREVEFQTAAESSSVLGRTLSNLSTQMFGMAQSMAESAGEEFVASNPITEVELQAMRDGDTKVFKREFSLNAFSAAVRKYKSQELSAHLELEMSNDAAEIQQAIELGRDKNGNAYTVDVKKIAEDWQAKTKGYGDSLAAIDPSAAYKFRAAAAVNGNRVLLAATKAASEQNFLKNQVKIDASVRLYTNTVRDTIINKSDILSAEDLQKELDIQRQTTIGNALVLGGVAAQKYAIEQTAQIEVDVKKAMFQNYVFSKGKGEIGDQVALEQKIRTNTLPPFLQKMWDGMSEPQRKAVRDGMAAEYQSLIKIKDEEKKISDMDTKREITKNTYTLYDQTLPENDSRKLEAWANLKTISLDRPDLLSPDFLYIQFPAYLKGLKEKAEDNPEGYIKIKQMFANGDFNNSTYEEIITKATAEPYKVTFKSVNDLIDKYLPKNAKENQKTIALMEIQHALRTKKIPTNDIEQLKKVLKDKNLTLADIPDDFIRLLNEEVKPEEQKPDLETFSKLRSMIDSSKIKDPVILWNEYSSGIKSKKYGYISDGMYTSLTQLISDKVRLREERLDKAGDVFADVLDAKNPKTKAQNRIEGRAFVEQKLKDLEAEFDKTGSFTDHQGKLVRGRRPLESDVAKFASVEGIEVKNSKELKNIEQSIKDNYGPSSALLPKETVKDSRLHLIEPKFKDDANLTVDPVYEENLKREFVRLKMGEAKVVNGKIVSVLTINAERLLQDIINMQRSAEKRRRGK